MTSQATTHRATFGDVLLAEWTKLRSLRSTTHTLVTTCLLAAGFAALISGGAAKEYGSMSAAERAEFDPTATTLQTFIVVQLAVAALGVLVVTSEYATGMIRTSLTAVSRRGSLLAAKALVLTALALAVGQVAAFASFLVGRAFLAGEGVPHAALGDPGVLRAVLGQGLYLAMVGLLGVAVGVLVRATAGAIVAMVAITLLVPGFAGALPEAVANVVGRYWPTIAGQEVMNVVHDPATLSPWSGFAVLCAWTAAALVAAFVVFHRRDA